MQAFKGADNQRIIAGQPGGFDRAVRVGNPAADGVDDEDVEEAVDDDLGCGVLVGELTLKQVGKGVVGTFARDDRRVEEEGMAENTADIRW